MTSPAATVQRVPTRLLDMRICRAFLDADACATLIDLIEAERRPSTIADDVGQPLFRTSETCDLDASRPVVARLDAAIAELLDLDPAHGERVQGQRYAVGQEFKLHTDYFERRGADYDKYCGRWGQRTWTAMVYLNVPAAGGATRFKAIDKTIQPELGKLVAWNNLGADGRPNFATLHQGMKVRAGVKYIVTKWYRERPVA